MEWKLQIAEKHGLAPETLETFLSGMETPAQASAPSIVGGLETFLSGMETVLVRHPARDTGLP